MPDIKISLNSKLTQADSNILVRYLAESYRFSRQEWQAVIRAMSCLGQSQVSFQGQLYTFEQFYTQIIDTRYAEPFLQRLYDLTDLSMEGQRLQAAVAREITNWLHQVGFRADQTDYAYYLIAYCLYRWSAFARGYAFESLIFRDLEASGVDFTPHDPRLLSERYAGHDLKVGAWKGDVKLSFYFLPEGEKALSLDFYVSHLYDLGQRRYRIVVLIRLSVWKQLDGDTLPGRLVSALSILPQPVHLTLSGQTWVLTLYSEWKRRILHLQGAKDVT